MESIKIDFWNKIYMTDFAAYLHNPYGYPTPIQKASILCFTRASRFVEGYDPVEELDNLILQHFCTIEQLHRKGLKFHYNLLKDTVVEDKKIGLILMGADRSRDDRKYYDYETVSGTIINLTRQSICYCLLKEYFTNAEIDILCKETPNFNIYYNNERSVSQDT